jgi:hypothetical protein
VTEQGLGLFDEVDPKELFLLCLLWITRMSVG